LLLGVWPRRLKKKAVAILSKKKKKKKKKNMQARNNKPREITFSEDQVLLLEY